MDSLSERHIEVLMRVVELFNKTGEPVGSATVAQCDGISVSPATIRNVMSKLEDKGLLIQPHTSAGRMPSPTGMRIYVDRLVETGQLAPKFDVDWQLRRDGTEEGDLKSLLQTAGLVISELSQLTSIVSSPEISQIQLKDLHLSWLSEDRIMVILITEDGRVFNRAVRLDEPVDRSSLERMQNFLSEQVVGCSLDEVRQRVQNQLEVAETQYREFMGRAIQIGQEVVEMATESELFVEGTLHMLDVSELSRDIERARDVMRTLEDRERLLEVLNRVCETPRAQTLIGSELGEVWGDDLSLVACGYFYRGRQVGLVGILGPMRMNYARVIPLVENAADVLSRKFDELA